MATVWMTAQPETYPPRAGFPSSAPVALAAPFRRQEEAAVFVAASPVATVIHVPPTTGDPSASRGVPIKLQHRAL